MEDQPTCGRGLAEHSALPAKLAELTDSVADNLEIHMKALDLTDENSRKEHDAYVELATIHRRTATELQATASKMAGYRDLPMGRHNAEEMSRPEVREALENLVRVEQELLEMLEGRVERDRKMLMETAI